MDTNEKRLARISSQISRLRKLIGSLEGQRDELLCELVAERGGSVRKDIVAISGVSRWRVAQIVKASETAET